MVKSRKRRGSGGIFSRQSNNQMRDRMDEEYIKRAVKELKLKDMYVNFLREKAQLHGNEINVMTHTWIDGSKIDWPKSDIDLSESQKMIKIGSNAACYIDSKRFDT